MAREPNGLGAELFMHLLNPPPTTSSSSPEWQRCLSGSGRRRLDDGFKCERELVCIRRMEQIVLLRNINGGLMVTRSVVVGVAGCILMGV